MAYEKLILTKENGIATATFNRPEVLNALDQELHIELHEAIREIRDEREVRVMVITGAGRSFAADRDVNQQASFAWSESRPAPDTSRPSGTP